MEQIVLKAYGKLNLSLGITGVRGDGYHLLDMVMQSVDLWDTLTITKTAGEGVTLTCSDPSLPVDRGNIALRACEKFLKALGLPPKGIHIDIKKNIPHGGGMGGGSADAAGVLVGLNRLFDFPFDREKLCDMGLTMGADVPFCIKGGTMRVQGIGEILTSLPPLKGVYFVIAKPPTGISTGWAYKTYDTCAQKTKVDNQALTNAIARGDIGALAANMANALEDAVALPEIAALKEELQLLGAKKAMMTGSGSCVFGVFDSLRGAEHCAEKLKSKDSALFVTAAKAVTEGVAVIG